MGPRLAKPAAAASILVLLLLAATPPAGADASDLLLDDDSVDVGADLSGTVVDGPADDGNRIIVSLDADGDGVYDNGEPQVRISSDDAGTALPWSGLETSGLPVGNYTVYAQEGSNVKNKDALAGATATVRLVDFPPTISNFQVTNPVGGEIQVQFESSEPLSAIAVSVAGPETATLSTADFAESGSGPYAYTATYVASTAGTYTVTLESAVDAGGNDGAGGESDDVTVAVDTPPGLLAAETADADGDGTVESIRLVFTEPIDDDSLAVDDVEVDGATVTDVSTGAVADDDEAVLAVTGLAEGDTSLTPRIVLPPRRVSDLAGNDGPAKATSLTPTDGAAPVILSAATGDADADGRIDRLNVSLSENVVPASVDGTDYDVGQATYVGERVVAAPPWERYLLLGFDEGSTDDTGATPPLAYVSGSTVDDAGNGMADRTLLATDDGAAPTIALSATDARQDGFDVRFSSSEAASATYVVLEDGATAPTTAQVLLGRDADGTQALRWGTVLVPGAGLNGSAAVTGLPSDTAYDVYAVTTDPAGNRRSPPASTDASTAPVPVADGDRVTGRRGTSVRASFSRTDGVSIEIRNPPTSRAVSVPLGGVGSSGIVYRRVTFEFDRRVGTVGIRFIPGERDAADPAMTDARPLEYFAARRVDGGPSPISSTTFEVQVRPAALPDGSSLVDVAFYRYADGRWIELESRRAGDAFHVVTDGFSSFAVAVPLPQDTPPPATTDPPATAKTEPAGGPTATGTPETATTSAGAPPTTTIEPGRLDGGTVALVVGIALLLAFSAIAWVLQRRRRPD